MRNILRLWVTLATILALLLTACGKVPTATSVPDNADPNPTIRFLSFGDPATDALISAFDEKYPNYRVEKVDFPGGAGVNFNDVINQKIGEGAVDVTITYITRQMVKDGLFAPLDPFVQKSGFDLKVYGPGLDSLKTDGKLLGLPYTISPEVIVYNKDMFEAAGVPLPKAGWTWEDLRADAAKLTHGDGKSKVWGFDATFVDGLIGRYVNQKSGAAKLIDDPAALKEAFQLFSTMIFTDQSLQKAAKQDPNSPIWVGQGPFSQGKAAISLEWLYSLRSATQQAKFKWDMAPNPTIPGGKNLIPVSPQRLVIAANSKNQAAAWDFVSFACGPEGAKILARQGQVPMWRGPDVKKAWFEQQPTPPPGTAALFSTTFTIPPRDPAIKPDRMSSDAVQQIFNKMSAATNAALSGDKPWEDALKDYLTAQDQLSKAMQ